MRIQRLRTNISAIGRTVVAAALLLTFMPQPVPLQTAAAASNGIDRVIQIGSSYLGTPYEFGSNRSTIRTFDCSDFVHHVFLKGEGLSLPLTSASQALYVKTHSSVKTSWRNLKRGDLMFFMDYHGLSQSDYTKYSKSRQPVTHVAIYLGNGRMLHTFSKASGGVRTDTIAGKHWESRFLFGGSV